MSDEEKKERKRKLLTYPERTWAKCQVCKEVGNLENLIYQKIPLKDKAGKELYSCFTGVYFCGESCQGLFS